MFTRAEELSSSQNMVGGLGTVGTKRAHTAQQQTVYSPTSTPHSLLGAGKKYLKAKPRTSVCQASLDTSYKYLPISMSSQKCPLNYSYCSAERIIYKAPH